jgi:hypothetical protein
VLLSLDLLRHLAENPIENLIRQVNGFIYRVARGNHAHVDLSFPRQSQTRDNARAEIDQRTVGPGNTGVGIEHTDSIDEQVAKGIRSREGR